MASFTTIARWERYVPALGNNKQLAQPFYLRVLASMSKAELGRWEALRDAFWRATIGEGRPLDVEALDQLFGNVVEMGDEPLVIDGRPVEGLRGYLELVADQPSTELLLELLGAVTWHNNVMGARANFSQRLAGDTAPYMATPQAAPPSGTRTSS